MKTIVLTFCILLLSLPVTAQELVAFNDGNQSHYQMKADGNLKSHDTKRVTTSAKVEALRAKWAEYDLKNEKIYSKHASTGYKVVLTDGTNSIEAIYDSRGTIASAIETYENVRLPDEIIKQVLIENQGWAIEKARYTVSFTADRQTETQYKIEIIKDGKKRTVKISE